MNSASGARLRVPALATALLVLAGCTTAVPGTPVVTPRLLAEAAAYRACAEAVVRIEHDIDALLDAISRSASPDPGSADRATIGALYGRMATTLEAGCGYWPVQGEPLSTLVLHLAEQRTIRTGRAAAATSMMIRSICGSVESAVDTFGVNLTAEAHAVCEAATG